MSKAKKRKQKSKPVDKVIRLTMPIEMKLLLLRVATESQTSLDTVVSVLLAVSMIRGDQR